MKKTICVVFVIMSCFISQAQVAIEENDLIKLLSNTTVVYSDQDTLMDGQIIKKIELEFKNKTMFYRAYLSSVPFTGKVSECDFVSFDDNLTLSYKELEDLTKLKSELNHIMKSTHIVKYKRKYTPWWYINE